MRQRARPICTSAYISGYDPSPAINPLRSHAAIALNMLDIDVRDAPQKRTDLCSPPHRPCGPPRTTSRGVDTLSIETDRTLANQDRSVARFPTRTRLHWVEVARGSRHAHSQMPRCISRGGFLFRV
jgi:hypothetical protein